MTKFRLVIQDKPHALARVDIILATVFAFANLIVLLLTWRTVGIQADESLNIYGALRLLDGARIYRDFWVFNAPGIFFLTAAVCAIAKSLFAIRIVLMLTASAAASAIYLVGRKFMGISFSALAPTLFIFVGVNQWPVASHHWYTSLILIFSVLFVARFFENRARITSLFVGSLLAGTTFLFQQPQGGALLVFLLFVILGDWFLQGREPSLKNGLGRAVFIFVAGACAPVLAFVLYFALVGTLRDAVSATIMFPLSRLSEGGGGQTGFLHYYGALTSSLLLQKVHHSSVLAGAVWPTSVVTFLINYAGPLSIPIAMAVWGIRRLRKKEDNSVALLCSLAALAGFGSSLQKPDFHHLLTTSAPCYLTLAYVLHRISGESGLSKVMLVRKALSACLAIALVVSSLIIGGATLSYASRIQVVSLGSPLGFIPAFTKENGEVLAYTPLMNLLDFIQLNTRADEKIFVMSFSPFVYYLSNRQNPTIYIDIPSSPCGGAGSSFHMLKHGEASHNRKRLETAVEQIEADKTRFVVLDPAASCQITGNLKDIAFQTDPLINYIQKHYRLEEDFGGYIVMMRN